MRRTCALIVLLTVAAACSTEAGAESTTTTSRASTTTTTSSTAATTTTTTSLTTTTTTTTVPALDRSPAATAARLQHDLGQLMANGPRVSGTASEAAAVEWFADTAGAVTGVVAAIQPVPLPNGTESANVWVGPFGSGDLVVLFGAHIDSIAGSPGADDNGSGTVILMELLRRLAEEPPLGVRVVVVAFGAEEYVPGYGHHYGSVLAAAEMAGTGTLPDFMVSVDMVGVGEQLHSTPYRDGDHLFAEEVVAIGVGAGVELNLHPRGDISDHVPFAMAGVSSVMLFRGDNPDYHTPADDLVDMDAVLEVLTVVEAIVAHLGG